jgi:Putative Ig domain
LAFVTEPTGVGNSSPTTAFPLNPTVEVEDAFGNIENSFTSTYANASVAVAMYLGTVSTSPNTAQTLTGCTPSFSNGIYTLTSCAGSKVNNGLLLYATGSYKNSSGTTVTLTATTSTAFNITGAATQLLFTTQPTAGASGSAFTRQPVLVYKDASGDVVTAETASVTPSVSGGTLSSCTNLAPTLGIVTVANCTFAGLDTSSYTMTFTGGGLTSLPSSPFTPTGPGPAAQLVFVSPAPVAAAADAVMTIQPSVQVEDSAGNHVSTSNASVTFSSTGNGVIANCTDLTALAGTVNASSCTFGGAVGTSYNLIATSGSLASAQSGPIQVTGPGPVSQILLSPSCASTITVTSSCVLTATLEDNFQNVETADNASVVTFSVLPVNSFTGLGNLTVSGGVTAGKTVTAATAGLATLSASADGVTSNGVAITVNALPSITTTTLPAATRTQTNYSQTLVGTGGTLPYTWSLSGGALPTGLTLNGSTGVISGTVSSSATTSTFSVTMTDADGVTATKSLSITVNVAPSVTTASLATATQTQTNYSQTLAGTGGTVPYTWSVTSGSLPSGLSLNSATGVISGTLSSSATTQTFTVTLSDVNGVTATRSLTLTVDVKPTISPTTLPAATQTGTYSQALSVSGGLTPFGAWSVSSGSLPTGLTLNTSSGLISGTVGASATTQTFSIQTTDANGVAAVQSFTLTVNLVPNITTTTLPSATSTGAYSQTLAVTGGTGPITWSVSAGTLPTGLTLNTSTGAITGSSVTGTTQTFTVKAIDANGVFDTQALTLTVNPAPSVTTTSLATATDTQTGYAQTLTGTGGTTFYTWSVTVGTLPSGLSLNPASGVISGTVGSSATSQTFTVTLTDANGVKATKSLTITVNVVPNITTTSLAAATQTQTGYTQTLAVTGGTTPYVGWSITTGSLPSGLSLNASTGVISGTVGSSATTQTFTVELTDANAVSDTQVLTLTVNTAPSITTTTLPAATSTGAYSQTVAETGGTTPLTWSISTGTLPTGLTLNTSTGAITGSSVTGTTQTFTVKATDAHGIFGTKSLTITVNAAPNITTSSLAAATQTETGYSQTLAVSGGTTAFTWSLSSGSLPTGLSLSSAGVISGTVGSGAATQTFTVKATDANGVFDTQSLTLTVNAATSITTSSLQAATKSAAYSQTLAATGGTGSLTWSVSSGTLPTGLTLSSSTGAITGSSVTGTTQNITVKAIDANGVFDTQALTVTVNAATNITTTTVATATQTETGYSQTLAVAGGTTPFTWSLSSGALPSGLSLNASTGVISGTVGSTATTQTFTVKAIDANGSFDTQSLTLTVYAAPNITTTTLPNARAGNHAYSVQLAVTGGKPTIVWTISGGGNSFGGFTLSTSGLISASDVTAPDGTYDFTVVATDADGVTDTQDLSITVTG